ncbi:long-chain-fatty-acid--CoA ligase [Limisalsivibrio acetivorans]|uniref:long-chain-fatty-acid--CoA ligase n=1 Tax=Limisalsivibrio acetivorans TaxID=1304888 RepID=UPI0003B60E99|nr:long-chain-fatty-acid--CoA ligase [Limisalsivibrio acetivorans]
MSFENLPNILFSNASKRGGKPFLRYEGEKYTYDQINKLTNRIASALMTKGVSKGDRVCCLLENSPEFIISLFAVTKCGAVFVPVNTFLKRDEVAYILNDSGAKYLITSPAFHEAASGIEKEAENLKGIMSYEETGFRSENLYTLSADFSDNDVETGLSGDDTAVIIYSSGTTGHPKGAVLSHSNLVSNADACLKRFKVKRNDRFLLFLPAFHSYALMTCVILPPYCGASIIILKGVQELKKKSFKKVLIFQRPTFFLGIPQVYIALNKSSMPAWFRKFVYPIRLHVSGGAPLPEEIIEGFSEKFGKPIIEGYGLSEASPVVSVNFTKKQKPLSVGPALDGVEVKVVDEREMELPLGEVGELIVRGPNVMKGYWNMPGLTNETIRNGWLFTGDLAKIDEEGFIYIVDRKKDLILVKGMNVYPREIEEVLHRYEGVEAAAVIGIPDRHSGEVPEAYIKPKEDAELDPSAIKKFLRERLANYKIPKHVIIKEDLPLTATGKILKRELKAEVLEKIRNKKNENQ